MSCFSKKSRDTAHYRQCELLIISMARLAALMPVHFPVYPLPPPQTFLIAIADQRLKVHLVILFWCRGCPFQIALEHFMAHFVSELETLDQTVTNQRVRWIVSVNLQCFFQARNGILQRGDIQILICHMCLLIVSAIAPSSHWAMIKNPVP